MQYVKTRWYAIISITVESRDEADYRDTSNIIALSENRGLIYEFAHALNADNGKDYDVKTLNEVLDDYDTYAGSQLYVVDRLDLTEKEAQEFEKDRRIIGRPGFHLKL